MMEDGSRSYSYKTTRTQEMSHFNNIGHILLPVPLLKSNFSPQIFPWEIIRLKNLRELQFPGNSLKVLPDDISELVDLQVLDN